MNKYQKLTLVILAFFLVTISAFFLAENIRDNVVIREFVQKLGLFGVVIVGIVAGLNALVPIPPATFAPIFLESGIAEIWIIAGFVVGTTIADSIGFLLGWLGSGYAKTSYPKITQKLQSSMEKHVRLIPFIIFAFFLLAPLPNETILIPLAIIGYQYKKLILPLIIGNIGHQTMMVLGYSSIFQTLF